MTATTMAGFTCWTPKGSHETVFVDAASPSDAVFLATHEPMRLIRRPLRGMSEGVFVNERDMLTEFLSPDEKMMLLPIIGGSGTGKSHLVRWMRAMIGVDNPRRRVVYVPKHGTSLRKVIELILDQMEGPEVDELRAKLREATSKLDARTAPSAVLAALADCLEYQPQRQTGDPEKDSSRDELLTLIPELLRDPVFRHNFFLADGATIRTFVTRALEGHRPNDHEEAFEFTAEALRKVTYLTATDASKPARDAQDRLRTEPSATYAAELLTENLGAAIQSVFGLQGSVSLTDVMMNTRRVLKERDQELLLLIEDFTMLQGIQRELLDAIVEPPDRDGEAPLCGIRITLAVTSGYWDTLADTVRTRAGFASHVYDLNVSLDPSDQQFRIVPSMISRYLNAARLGRTRLEEAYALEREGNWVPNACTACTFQVQCLDAFGEVDGRGLYPFNEVAIARTVSATSDSNYLDPRAILGSVVKYTLEQNHADLAEGRFPSAEFQQHFTSTASHQSSLPNYVRLEAQDYPDAERRVGLLTIWGGCPTELIDLDSVVHDAFRIPMVGIDAPATRREASQKDRKEVPRQTGDAPTGAVTEADTLTVQVKNDLEEINGWIAGTNLLGDRVARQVRRHLADSLWEAVDWDTHLIKLDKDSRDRLMGQASFSIHDSAGGRAPGSGMWVSELARTVKIGAVVSGIVEFEAIGHWAFPGGPAALQHRLDLLDTWATSLMTHIRMNSGVSTPAEQRAIILELAANACILGAPGVDSDDPVEVLSAVLSPPEKFSIERVMSRSDRLTQVARDGFDRRRLLLGPLMTHLGARQGGGTAVYALDTRALLPAVEEFVSNPTKVLPPAVMDGVSREVEFIRQTLERIDELMGEQTESPSLAAVVRAAAETAGELTIFYPGNELSGFISQTRQAESFDTTMIDEARIAVATYIETDIRSTLMWISKQPGVTLTEYLRFLQDAHRRLKDALDRATQKSNAAVESPETAVLTEALARICHSLRGAG